jgi:predicted Zn-dependent protease
VRARRRRGGEAREASAECYTIADPVHSRGPAGRLRRAPAWVSLAAACALLSACQAVPITGRKAFNPLPVSYDVEIGRAAYDQAVEGGALITSGPELAMVQQVMDDLVAVADDPGYEWEVRLIDDDQMVNAFALPGGKMAVYTGILPVCQDATGLAVVMGHEIGHVVARHGTNRMVPEVGVEVILSLFDLGDYETLARLGVQYGIRLPFSRRDESEADHIGLIYMARAGYDPRRAVQFWQGMAAATGGGPPELLSTHPSHDTRIDDLHARMDEALREYRP